MPIWTNVEKLALLVMCSFIVSSNTIAEEGYEIISPFGFERPEPPRAAAVEIINHEVGLSAQQTCGYTDWRTVSLKLPKKLLSKEYWRKVSGSLVQTAKDSAMAISGALPGMIACNVSPTYCHLFNQAEVMAAFEGQLTFNTCKMLDGIANTSGLQAESLRNCVSTMIKTEKLSASEARERCLNEAGRKGQISKTAKLADKEGSFSMPSFIASIFPDRVQTISGESHSFKNSDPVYSRVWKTKAFMKEVFPGLEVVGRASVMKGGTFQPTVDKKVRQKAKEIRVFLYKILKEIHKLKMQGRSKRYILRHLRRKLHNKKAWAKGLAPIFRPIDGADPVYLISPRQILILLNLYDDKVLLGQVIDQLAMAASEVKINDMLSDIYVKTLDQCKRDPKYQGAVAQKNCELILNRTKADMEILVMKRASEIHARNVQIEVARIVMQNQKGYEAPQTQALKKNKGNVLWPNEL